jgi:hypothetical protein
MTRTKYFFRGVFREWCGADSLIRRYDLGQSAADMYTLKRQAIQLSKVTLLARRGIFHVGTKNREYMLVK